MERFRPPDLDQSREYPIFVCSSIAEMQQMRDVFIEETRRWIETDANRPNRFAYFALNLRENSFHLKPV